MNVLSARRERAIEAMRLEDAVLLIGAGEPIPLPEGSDQTYPFRSHAEYIYFAGGECVGGVLAVDVRGGVASEWASFAPDPTERERAAITESGFGYRMSMNSVNRKTNVVITVFCYFNKKHSWVKKGMENDYALRHEQNHFNITYINAWLFVQKLKEAQLNMGNFNYLVEKINDESFDALEKMQNDYDGQTSNGRINRMQNIWNKKIEQQLAEVITN